jgi:sugar phosphate isomerase/epimerase
MNLWPIGLSTGCFYYRSFFDIIDAVQASGFRQIEICSYPRHLDYHNDDQVRRAGDRLRELDLHPFSFHAPFADHIDITSFDDSVRRAAVEELLTACHAAAAMGVRHVVLHPGPERSGRPPEHEFLRHMKLAAESLNVVARRCAELSVRLLLENMLPHLLFGRTSDMLFLLGEIKEADVGACLDTGHANLAGDLPLVVHKLSGHLKMLHVNDNRGNSDAHLCPGDGVINWRGLLTELRKHHFKGSLILELSSQPHESPQEVLSRARRASDYLIEAAREENLTS